MGCGKKQKAFVAANEVCLKKPSNEAATCWEAQLKAVTDIKESKCTADVKKSQDAVAKLKNDCLASFVACKKKEDAAVSHSANCTEGTVKSVSDINKQHNLHKGYTSLGPGCGRGGPRRGGFHGISRDHAPRDTRYRAIYIQTITDIKKHYDKLKNNEK